MLTDSFNIKDGILCQLYLNNYTYLIRTNRGILCACKKKAYKEKEQLSVDNS